MSRDTWVLRTQHAEGVGLLERYDKERKAWLRKVEKLRKELLPGKKRNPIVMTSSWDDRQTLVGFESFMVEAGDRFYRYKHEEAPDGWRIDKDGYMVPFKSKKEGKAIAARLAAVKPPESPRRRLPGGMPGSLFLGLSSSRCGIEEHHGWLYVLWASDPATFGKKGEAIDPDVWEPVKLSAFYAMKEAQEAA